MSTVVELKAVKSSPHSAALTATSKDQRLPQLHHGISRFPRSDGQQCSSSLNHAHDDKSCGSKLATSVLAQTTLGPLAAAATRRGVRRGACKTTSV